MQKTTFKEIKVKLPSDIAKTVSEKEIVEMLLDKALTNAEYYRSKCNEYMEKYGMDFASFKKKVEESQEEVFSDWDDLLVWEGFELAYKEWKKKCEGLKGCTE